MNTSSAGRSHILWFWAICFFMLMIAVWFLHEAAHGFGYWLEGKHVSTGFNLVGASGKVPNDPDFTLNLPLVGLTPGLLLGPLSSWTLAIACTAILLSKASGRRWSLLIGAAAVAGAMMRLVPLAVFFIAAMAGNISGVLQDEQLMSLGQIERLVLPLSRAELITLVASEPAIFLHDLSFYLWPLLSLGISLVCLVFAYRFLFGQFRPQLQARWRRIGFALLPFLLYFPVFGVVTMLDHLVRINW